MQAVSKRALRPFILFVEIVSVLAAAVAALAGVLVWSLNRGAVDLPLLKGGVEFAAEQALGAGSDVFVGRALLSRSGHGLKLELLRTEIKDSAGKTAATVPKITSEFSLRNFFAGRDSVRRIEIDEPEIVLVQASGTKSNVLSNLRNLRGFDLIEARNGRVRFEDPASGKTWRATGVSGAFSRTKAGYRMQANGDFNLGGEKGGLALDAIYTRQSGIVTAEGRFDRAPLGDILGAVQKSGAVVVSAPFSGRAALTITDAGQVLSSTIDGDVAAGEILAGEKRLPLKAISISAAFDPESDTFDLERLRFDAAGVSGEISGAVRLTAGEGDRIESASFELRAPAVTLDPKDVFDAPLELSNLDLAGFFEAASGRVALNAFRLEALGVVLKGAAVLTPHEGGSPEVQAELTVEGELDPQRLVHAWPVNLGDGAREFVDTRLPAARIHDISAKLDLKAGDLTKGGPLPDEALAVRFEVDGGTVYYVQTMPPLTHGHGEGLLTGNRFTVKNMRGAVGAIAVSNGDVEFTALSPKDKPVYYRFNAEGGVKDILTVLNSEPLLVLETTSFTPDRFDGKVRVRAEIMHPNKRDAPREDFRFKAAASFENAAISEFYRSADFEAAHGTVDLTTEKMRISGKGLLGGSPVEVDWIQPLGQDDQDGTFNFSGVIDSSTGDVMGIPSRQLMLGQASFTASAVGRLESLRQMKINADLTNAALMADAFEWRKGQGVPAKGEATLEFDGAAMSITELAISGEGLDVRGRARFGADGGLEEASFAKIALGGSADFSLNAARSPDGPFEATLNGAYLNIAGLVKQTVEGKPRASDSGDDSNKSEEEGLRVRARLDRLVLRGGAEYRDASLDLRRERGSLQDLDFSARTLGGAPLSVGMINTGADAGPMRSVEARTDDIGSLLSGLFGVSSVKGGEGSMEIQIGSGRQGLEGICEARGMRIVKAPLLARIFSAGSFVGLSDLLNGDGIALNRAYAKFAYADGVLKIEESRASGPSVGLTASGSVTTGAAGTVDLEGAIAPAYQVNSLLGKTPIIGDLFVNRQGEGLVALSYDVKGPAAEPTVTVNPLSALAPGFLRRMFEIDRPTTEEQPAATRP